MPTQQQKCKTFAKLHVKSNAFIMPNPWDLGSAKVLQGLGFEALATTSSGLAYTLGRTDGEVSLEECLKHCQILSDNTRIPINADFENGFADDPEQVATNILRVVETGVSGCSIEDFNPATNSIYDFNLSLERMHAATEVIATLNIPFQLTARAENLIHGINDIDDTIKRLKAFEVAGANVLYAPGINSLEQLRMVTNELSMPFNVLAPFIRKASVNDLADAGAKRISIGGALNWSAVNPVLIAGKEMLNRGTFEWMNSMAPSNEVNSYLEKN